ncbi:MAG: sensor domain-containing diguanylate cyclase, partial [Candidatus Eremiobacteraeota bacterium]|nr:sensor domain-containing diguanylate cyclase [Candidatus Eremiobacteraeota bacterium]
AEVEPLLAPDGAIIGVQGNARPAQEKLAAERRSSIVAHAEMIAGSGSWFYDARSGDYEWSDGLYELLGADCWMPFSRNVRLYDFPDDAKSVELAVTHARLAHEPYSIDHRIVRADGAVRFVQEKAAFYFDDAGRLTHVIGTMLDVTDRKAGENRLAYLAYHDPLSNLPNRTLLEERFTVCLERARQNKSLCGVLFIDIDGFKHINDSLGHGLGDDLLRAIAARLSRHVRSGDTLARFGGDEFVVLLDSLKDETDGQCVAHTILGIFEDPFRLGHHQVSIKASIGIAFAPPDGITLADVLAAADSAMYSAKRLGGNLAVLSQQETDRQLVG